MNGKSMFVRTGLRALARGERHLCRVRSLSSRLTVKEATAADTPKENVAVTGWVKSVRKKKELVFVDIGDGSTANRLQVVVSPEQLRGITLNMGCSLVARGNLVESLHSGQKMEMKASHLDLLGPCDPKEYPFKRGIIHGMDYIRQFPHLRAHTTIFSRVLRIRNSATMAVHRFFQDRGFIQVHTPIITSSDCEGAGELFEIRPADEEDTFFPSKAYLTVSGQLHAEAIACGMNSVYTFGPTFRAEKSHTKRHLAEFQMVEAETITLNTGLQGLLELMENFYKLTLEETLKNSSQDMAYFHEEVCSPNTKTSILNSLEQPFRSMTYSEAITVLKEVHCQQNFEFPPQWGCDLQREHELFLLAHCGQLPLFITEFPSSIKPFYARTLDSNSALVAAVDLLVPGVGEVVGGSLREEREEVLRETLGRLDVLDKYQWYLDLRRFGSVPHGGFGLGFERFLQAILGLDNIRDVVPFPRFLGSCQL